MRSQAKARSAGTNSGDGKGRGLDGRALATRAGFRDADGRGAPSQRRTGLAVLAFFVLLVLVVAPTAFAGKAVVGVFGTPPASLGGQVNNPAGLAVNTTGAGGVTAGDVYVSDNGNVRVEEFSGDGDFVRAFGWDVVAGGEHNTGVNEKQTVTVNATGGTFSLNPITGTGFGQKTSGSNVITGYVPLTGSLHVGDTLSGGGIPAGTVVTAIGTDTVTMSKAATGTFNTEFTISQTTGATGSGNTTSGSNEVTGVTVTAGSFAIGQTISGTGIPAGTTIAGVGAGTLTLSAAATANGTAVALTATSIPFNVTSAQLALALEALSGIGAGGVTVTGGPGGTAALTVEFKDLLAGNDIGQMTSVATNLTGGTKAATIATTVAGGGYEICEADSSPQDVCKKGVAGAAAGQLNISRGVAIDLDTGNLYVTSNANRRVDVFSATGTFQGAFGWNVKQTGAAEELQFCTVATGCKAAVAGSAAGQLGTIGETAHPAVRQSTGDVYVPDPSNRRVNQYTPIVNGSDEVTGVSFVRAVGQDVIPAINEKQSVTVTGATGGSFTLTFEGQTTKATGTGNVTSGSNEITGFSTSSGTFVQGEAVSGPGIPAGATIVAVNAGVITISAPATATNAGASIVGALPYNAASGTVQGALRALSNIGGTNVNVSGGPAGTTALTVEFTGALSGIDVAQMTTDGAELTGGGPSVAVATTQQGANGTGTGIESCTAATTCKAGAELFLNNKPSAVAVDSSGATYAVNSGKLNKFSPAGDSVEEFAPAVLTGEISLTPVDVAVDPTNDHVFVTKRTGTESFKIYEFNESGGLVDSFPPGEAGTKGGSNLFVHGLAIGTEERLYFSSSDHRIQILAPPPAPKSTISPVTGVTPTEATFAGSVELAEPGPEGGFPTFAQFEYSSNGFTWQKAPADQEIALGDGSGAGSPNSCPAGNPPKCNVSYTIKGLAPNTEYVVRLSASNGTTVKSDTASFQTGAAAPSVTGLNADPVGQTTAKLNGFVNPNGQATTYYFEWGTDTDYGSRVPADLDPVVGSGTQKVKVSANLSGLTENTTYHFRIVATNESGTTVSPDAQLTTLNSAGLPDNRGFELVSPPNKRPQGESRAQFTNLFVSYQAAEDGESVLFPYLGALETDAGGDTTYLGTRTEDEWGSVKLSPPSLVTAPTNGLFGNSIPGIVSYASSDLSCVVVNSFNPITDDTPVASVELGLNNLYRRNPDGTHTLLTAAVPSNPEIEPITPGGFPVGTVAGASEDCSRIYFQSPYNYLPEPSGLYEWHDGVLSDAGRLPDGAKPTKAAPGGETGRGTRWHSVSRDGSRFFFSATSNAPATIGKEAVFVRENGVVTEVSAKQGGTADNLGATYAGASPDGSHVYFQGNYGLTPDSSSGPQENCANLEVPLLKACALYEYDVDSGTLTDLSADSNPSDTKGAVVRGLIGTSDDGSVVYFVAQGQLIPGEGKNYAQNTGGNLANIYRSDDGDLTFVANVKVNDAGRMVQKAGGIFTSAEVTSDGQHLLFPAAANVTGYVSGSFEAYLYSAESEEIVCVSCRRDNQPSFGEVDQILLQSIFPNSPSWQAEIRNMSDDGTKVFFGSTNALAPGAVEGESNLYEWNQGQISFITYGKKPGFLTADATSFYGTTPSGNDVFLHTPKQLSPHDTDFVQDIYDLRVGGGFAPPVAPQPGCDPAADQCQGTPSTTPSAGSPSSEAFVGPGNPAVAEPRKKKCPRGKVLRKGKCVKKHKAKKQKAGSKRRANANRGGAK